MKNVQSIHSTTQTFLDIFDITNDLLILADGACAVVLSVSAINFGLLSEDEQDATIYAYAALLNSLTFPTQIVIRSQPKDVSTYLHLIEEKEQTTNNPVYRQRIREYRQFVESLVQEQNVLDKKFYIVVPLSAIDMGLTTKSVMPGAKNKPLSSFEKSFIIEKAKINLEPRRDHLVDQLARIGLYSRQLTTQELIQMLYSSYNPESFEGQRFTDTQNFTTPLVEAQIIGDYRMTDTTSTPNPTVTPVQAATPVETPVSNPTASAPPVAPTVEAPAATTPISSAAPTLAEQPIITTPAAPSAAAMPSAPVPPVTAAPTAVPTQPMPTPAATPAAPAAPAPAVESMASDEQQVINQTLTQLGGAPAPTADKTA